MASGVTVCEHHARPGPLRLRPRAHLRSTGTHEVEPADPKRLVAHPDRKALGKTLQGLRASTTRLIERRTTRTAGETARVEGKAMTPKELDQRITKQESDADRLAARIAKLPKEVPVNEILDPKRIVQLERERKTLIDSIKMAAYRAETSLTRLVEPLRGMRTSRGSSCSRFSRPPRT